MKSIISKILGAIQVFEKELCVFYIIKNWYIIYLNITHTHTLTCAMHEKPTKYDILYWSFANISFSFDNINFEKKKVISTKQL